jgi:hypothetical protein
MQCFGAFGWLKLKVMNTVNSFFMFCKHCGKDLGKSKTKFCKYCGEGTADEAPAKKSSSVVTNDDKPHPWRRYFARMLDLWIVAVTLGFCIGLIAPEFLDETPDMVFGIIASLVVLPYEAYLLSTWDRTIGKWLLGISVTKNNGKSLSVEEGFKRGWLVFYRGMGLAIPFVSLFTLIHQYGVLTKKGITTWDRDMECKVSYEKLQPLRVIIALGLVVGFIFLIALGAEA